MQYKIMLDTKTQGIQTSTALITPEGAAIIWNAYQTLFPSVSQTMEQRNKRGGICWLSEINSWKKNGDLPPNFEWTDYQIKTEDQ